LKQLEADIGISFTFSVNAKIEFEMLLYGAVGGELECSPALTFNKFVDGIDKTDKWELALEVPFGAGVELEIEIGTFKEEFERKIDFLTLKVVLLSGDITSSPSLQPSLLLSQAPSIGSVMPSASPTRYPTPPPTPSPPPNPTPPPPPPPDGGGAGVTSGNKYLQML
jgi:hypothetical protein